MHLPDPSADPKTPLDWLRFIAVGSEGLRSGWRFVGFTVFMGLVSAVCMPIPIALLFLLRGDPSNWGLLTALIAMLGLWVPAIPATWMGAWLLDRRRARSSGLGGPWLRSALELGGGVVVSVLVLSIAVAAVAIPSGSVGFAAPAAIDVLRGGVWLVLLFFAATWEEVVFRGYGFLWLVRGIADAIAWLLPTAADPEVRRRQVHLAARATAVIGSSLLFGALHLGNNDASWVSTANTAVAGIALATPILRTRSMWFSVGAHWGWNAAQALLWGTALSGLHGAPSLLQTGLVGPAWWTGGGYGIEASIVTTIAMLLLAVVGLVLPRRPRETAHSALTLPADP